MNRKDRSLLAENLRHYLSGRITNFEFVDRIDELYKSDDKAVVAIKKEFWFAHDDLREHRNSGKQKLNEESEDHVKRFILFLKSDNEYEWKDSVFPNPINWILNLITLKSYPKKIKESEKELLEIGDKQVWPFFHETDFEKEVNEPKYLNHKTPP